MKKALTIAIAIIIFCLGIGAATVAQRVQADICPHFTVIVDGEKQTFTDANGTEVYPLVYNGTTYLPVRAIAGLMGKDVGWDGATNTITLNNPSNNSGDSLLYEDENIAIRFEKITHETIYEWKGEQSCIYLSVTNKTTSECDLIMSTFAVNGQSYNDIDGRESVAPKSTGIIRFYTSAVLPTTGIETASGRLKLHSGDKLFEEYSITFSDKTVK